MPTSTVNGHNLHYETTGDPANPPLILLHQGLGSAAEWQPQVDAFSPSYYVINFDRWGYGRSDPRPGFGPNYLFDDTQEAIALLDHLNIRDAFILGHSDGGTIALLLAAQRPDLARALAIEAAHIYYEPRIHQGISDMVERTRRSKAVESYLARLHGPEKARVFIDHWFSRWLSAENLPDQIVPAELLASITCPVLVIQGVEDQYALPQHAIDIDTALPDSELWLIPEVDHTPHARLGDSFNRRVMAFFAPYAPSQPHQEEQT